MSEEETVRVVRRHHGLVRLAHWLFVPLLLGLVASGLSIHWAAPVLTRVDEAGRSRDLLVDAGLFLGRLFGDRGPDPRFWLYERAGLGPWQLAVALRLHWALAYLLMLTGALYLAGMAAGGGWRALLPRRGDAREALSMLRFYAGAVPMRLLRRPWPHPPVRAKYNALQRAAYLAVPLAVALIVLSGWAMHKPVSLGWLERAFGDYEVARRVHFACMALLVGFSVPHVALVIADGWDTLRSMVVGWSRRVREASDDRS